MCDLVRRGRSRNERPPPRPGPLTPADRKRADGVSSKYQYSASGRV